MFPARLKYIWPIACYNGLYAVKSLLLKAVGAKYLLHVSHIVATIYICIWLINDILFSTLGHNWAPLIPFDDNRLKINRFKRLKKILHQYVLVNLNEVLDLVASTSRGIVVSDISNEVFMQSPSEPINHRVEAGTGVIFGWKDNSHRSNIGTHTKHTHSQYDEQIPMIYGEWPFCLTLLFHCGNRVGRSNS